MTNGSKVPVFYDCEASCIGGLPIEIGWAFVDLSAGVIRSESQLVRPLSHWDLDPVWDPDAQKLHGISKEQLVATGRPPLEIARRMNETLAGRELFSDGPVDDDRWLRIIFGEAGLDPAFTVQMVHANQLTADLAAKLGWDEPGYEAAKAEAARLSPKTHRAEADARHLAVLWHLISHGPKRTVTTKEAQEAAGQGEIGQPDLQRLAASLLEAFPDRVSASWRDRDAAAADAEGWNVFNAGEPDARLERADDAGIFPDDGIAWLQVRSQALAGVPLAIRALAHLLDWNTGEFRRVISLSRPTRRPRRHGQRLFEGSWHRERSASGSW